MNKLNTIEHSKSQYKKLYSDVGRYIKMKLKARGIHDLIIAISKDDLRDKNILDIGCGLGRMSLLASKYAKNVVGIDHTKNAIDVANVLKSATYCKNVQFICTSLEDYKPEIQFDVVIISGTLEHIVNCEEMVSKIRTFIKKGGMLISDSPSEFNFRGVLHASLWKLFNFPMTLSDVNIITPKYMQYLAKTNGMKIEKSVGTLYSRAWGSAGESDLRQRMPNVIRDMGTKLKNVDINLEEYFNWLEQATVNFNKLLDSWIRMGVVKSIPKRKIKFMLNEKYINEKKLPLDLIREYMDPDFKVDPYYSEAEPYVNLSGNIIYFIRRVK